MKLTDTQLVLLSAAAQREDLALTLPANLEPADAVKIAAKLVSNGLVEEMESAGSMPVWRNSDDVAFALRITAAGLKAIGIEDDLCTATTAVASISTEGIIDPISQKTTRGNSRQPSGSKPSRPKSKAKAAARKDSGKASQPKPRKNSKIEQVTTLLVRKRGATIAEMIDATGWLPHTTRAVLTGLRKRGHVVEREAVADKPSIYRITQRAAADQQPGTPA